MPLSDGPGYFIAYPCGCVEKINIGKRGKEMPDVYCDAHEHRKTKTIKVKQVDGETKEMTRFQCEFLNQHGEVIVGKIKP